MIEQLPLDSVPSGQVTFRSVGVQSAFAESVILTFEYLGAPSAGVSWTVYLIGRPWGTSLGPVILRARVLVGVGEGESDAVEEAGDEPAATVAAAAINTRPANANPRHRMTEVRVDAAVVLASSIIGSITA